MNPIYWALIGLVVLYLLYRRFFHFARCQSCGRIFRMGYNGTVDGCDSCMGVERDRNGYAWGPGETEQTYEEVETGKTFTVKREDAFK